VDNEQGHATGWLPGQLSERGRAQARQLGRRRISDGITAVFSSDLARAAQTASVAFGASSIPVLYDGVPVVIAGKTTNIADLRGCGLDR
jgi:2,3-bisphosphoglycerate-dependent phosphoglycerate mutase